MWLFWFKAPQGQLAHWLEVLSQYDFTIVHRTGRRHANADALPQLDTDDPSASNCYPAGQELTGLPCQGCTHYTKVYEQWHRLNTDVDYVVSLAARLTTQSDDTSQDTAGQDADNWQLTYTPYKLQQEQATVPGLGTLRKWAVEERPNQAAVALKGPALKKYQLSWPQVITEHSILYYQWEEDQDGTAHKLLVPRQLQELLMQHVHDIPTGRYLGAEHTLAQVRWRYYWCGTRQDG